MAQTAGQFDSSERALVAAWFILGANKAPLSGVSAPCGADRFMTRTIASGLKGFSVSRWLTRYAIRVALKAI